MGNGQGTAPVASGKRAKGSMPYVAEKHVRGLPYSEHKLSLVEGRGWRCTCTCGWEGPESALRGPALGGAKQHLRIIRNYYRDSGLPPLPEPPPASRMERND